MPDASSVWIGGLAGLATALQWAMSVTAWGFASRRVHSLSVAALRILLAAVLMVAAHWIAFGEPWPVNLDIEPLVLLAISGALAMGLGDIWGFRAIFLIGPRLTTVIGSLCPIATTILAWVVAREALSARAVAGIVVIVAGVAWVVSEPHGQRSWRTAHEHFRRGVVLALGSTALTAVGYILSRAAMTGGPRWWTSGAPLPPVDPFQGTLIRVTAAALVTWAALPVFRQFRPTLAALANRKAMAIIAAGTTVGPVVGVWTSMIALKYAPSGIASALIGTSPIFMLPLSFLAFGEKPSPRSLAGTALAVAGLFLLLL